VGLHGRHFSGRWRNEGADGYITRVKDYLNQWI
jgi:hypothetical protein